MTSSLSAPRRTVTLAAVAVSAAAVVGVPAAASAATSAPSAPSRAVAACRGAAIRTTHRPVQGAAGSSYLTFEFRNVGARRCSLRGYPGLDALGRGGRVLRSARRTRGTTLGVTTVVVRPGAVVSAYAQWFNFDPSTGGACRRSRAIAVTPPNTSATVRFPVSTTLCGLQIHPVVPGRSGISG